MAFRTYTRIAREFGLTVPALKKALAAAVYLDGKTPTARAADEGLFEMRPIDREKPEDGSFPMWDRDKVEALLKKAELTGNKGFGVSSCHSACDQLGKAADQARKVKGAMPDDVQVALGWCEFENHQVLVAFLHDGRRAAGALAAKEMAPLLAWLKGRTGSKPAQEAARRLEAVAAWFASGRDHVRAPKAGEPHPTA